MYVKMSAQYQATIKTLQMLTTILGCLSLYTFFHSIHPKNTLENPKSYLQQRALFPSGLQINTTIASRHLHLQGPQHGNLSVFTQHIEKEPSTSPSPSENTLLFKFLT